MARGPKKHLKRLAAPKHWMLDKLGGTWAPRPSAGPHKLRECLPLTLILKNRLKYALNRKEVMAIVMRRLVAVDHKVRSDMSYPAGFQDVITIAKTDEKFRLLYDVKGRFAVHRISNEEAKFKLCRVLKVAVGSKASIGRNGGAVGQAGAVPYIVTHDGRTIRFPDPLAKIGDTVKLDLTTGKTVDTVKFEAGNVCMVTAGANKGRVGQLVSREKHHGGFEISHLKDRKGNSFATRSGNVFVIGDSKPWISLPRGKGIALTILEEREKAFGKEKKA
jgi:small subunit ribosomal protein S4e